MIKRMLIQVLRTEGRDKMRLRRPFRAAWVVVFLATTLLVSHASGQADIYVTTTGSDPLGANWSNATSFTNALAIAQPNDAIWLQQGTYTNAATFLVTANGLKLYGGFDGTETDLSQRDWTNNVVMLNGQGARLVIEIKAHNFTLDGLTITNGYNNTGVVANRKGAGLRMDGASYPATNLTMANCWVVNNNDASDSTYGGGAYFNNAGNVLISNCVFDGNRVNQGTGAGIYSLNSDLTVTDSRLSKNTSLGSSYRKNGDGIYFEGVSKTLDIRRCKIVDNGSTGSGSQGDGGGVYIRNGTASIVNAVIARNRSASEGGGVYHNSGTSSVESCTFVSNEPAGAYDGGAIYQKSGQVTVKNCIFWDNHAGSGKVGDTIYQAAGTLNLSYSCLDGTNSPSVEYAGTLIFGSGIITNDPLFAVPYTDVHLKSKLGRWDGSGWVRDDVSSPCIDAGDPASDDSLEPDGRYINLGAYGNTPEASRIAASGTIFILQ